jgi:putative endonuclease
MPDAVGRGRGQEDRAADYLAGIGYTIVTRRFRSRRGEIDVVALDGDQLVFVEVKARWAPGYSPEDSLGDAKRHALVRAGQAYLDFVEQPGRELRFDLVVIDRDGLRHYRDFLNEDSEFEPLTADIRTG